MIIGFCFSQLSVAQNKVSTQNGNWHTINWNPAGLPGPTNDVTLSHSLIIEKDSIVHINNLYIGQNGSLTVNGTLVVNGNIEMDNNGSSFKMGGSARVIVFGNFLASNKVDISISSYLIIHGDFIKKGSSGQGEFDVENGNIYIYGTVSGWPEFGECGTGEDYDGTPTEDGNCDYGTEEDFINNPDLPEDLIELSNCYDLSSISNQTVCEGQTAVFGIGQIQGVNYQWQKKTNDTDWTPVGSDVNTHSVPNLSFADNGNQYRVIVTPVNSENSTCRIGVSQSVSLYVNSAGIWTGAADTNWNNTANWSCSSLPTRTTNVVIPSGLTNYPIINTGANALAKNLTIEAGAEVTLTNNWLRIAGELVNSGNLNTETGSVSFEGTSAQTIPAGAFTGNRIQNLRINNLVGVTSQTTIEITNSLEVTAGTFATGDDLTLISNASGTAFIEGSGGGEITGTVKMQRYLDNGFGYKYFSSPFSNSTVADFSGFMEFSEATTGFPHFYEYLEGRRSGDTTDISGWQAFLEPGNSLNIAKGYALNISGVTDPVTIELSGIVNNGDVNIVLENNEGEYTKGFNLVGNPYPSPIDWSLMLPDLAGIDDAIYFFKAGSEDRYTGTYSSFVNGVSTRMNTTIIPSMQGFFVRVSEPGTATLNFTNAVRTGNETTQGFYKAKNTRIIPQIKLNAGYSGETISDAAVIYFQSGATSGFEKDLDALKLLNTAAEVPSLYSLTEKQEKLSINAISSAEHQEIPLGINTEKPGKMFIELAGVENIFPSANIYLKDQKNKLVHNFSEEPIYSFTSQKGENNNRFSLIFSSEKLSEDQLRSETEDFSVYSAEAEILVKLNLSENTSGNVILSNISGQVLQRKAGKEKEELRFSGITAPGVYLVSLEFENERQTKKILIKK
ncbi:T9SS type A sorting domain-containing protein [Salinimicrobium sp. CDJ15-81-2]|nr:T9SS type A sorting domain-containing protein [Salinimicrobium nanhaiense]